MSCVCALNVPFDGCRQRMAHLSTLVNVTGFTHLRDELIHQGYVVGFYDSYFTTPEGEEIRRDVVKHPGAVSAVAIEDGHVWLVKQFRAPIKGDLWEIPAGKLDIPGEPLEETVVRELEEEIGRRPGTVEPLIGMHHSAGFCDEFQTIFLCTDLTEVPVNHDGPEEAHMIVQKFPLETAVQMAMDGTITDGKSIVGLLAMARKYRI